MNDYILHPDTQQQLQQLLDSPLHAYIFIGPVGLGKTALAHFCLRTLVSGYNTEADATRWGTVVSTPPDKKKIPLAAVKEIGGLLNQKKPAHIQKKVVIIDDAENLSIEAANALLKLLEEPADDSVLILVSAHPDRVPLTVRSRLATVRFRKPTNDQIQNFFGSSYTAEVSQITNGFPAEVARCIVDHTELEGTILLHDNAERFLSVELSTKLAIAQQIVKADKAAVFLQRLARVVQTTGSNQANIEALLFADTHLYNSGNPRFVLEHLALELS